MYGSLLLAAVGLLVAFGPTGESKSTPQKFALPLTIDSPVSDDTPVTLASPNDKQQHETTINPFIQRHLEKFLKDRNSPIAAAVALDVKTGEVLAVVQGKHPQAWGATTHAALYPGFPAASLFKTVVTAAAFEVADVDADAPIGLAGGCAHVGPTGQWLRAEAINARNAITLRRAYGFSCNGFFAKLAVNYLGIGPISEFATRFGWGRPVDADFATEPSPIMTPPHASSSVQTVGRFAAGFGYVGISAAHAAWWTMAIANDGVAKPLKLFRHSKVDKAENEMSLAAKSGADRLITSETAEKIRDVMRATVRSGTATFAFRGSKYRNFRQLVGGKTGTLTGHSPKGLTTWFAGMMPLENPEIVVAAVVVLPEDLWFIKGPNLAAEAFWAFEQAKKNSTKLSQNTPRAIAR